MWEQLLDSSNLGQPWHVADVLELVDHVEHLVQSWNGGDFGENGSYSWDLAERRQYGLHEGDLAKIWKDLTDEWDFS